MPSSKIKGIIDQSLSEIAFYFPYCLLFFIIIFSSSFYFKEVKIFFFWPGVYAGMVILSVLTIFSPSCRKYYFYFKQSARKDLGLWKSLIIGLWSLIAHAMSSATKRVLEKWNDIKLLPRKVKIKIIVIIAISASAVLMGIGLINLAILIYGLISILFVFKRKISLIVCVILLVMCSILAILNYNKWVDIVGVGAFYFLILSLLTEIRDMAMPRGRVKMKKLSTGFY